MNTQACIGLRLQAGSDRNLVEEAIRGQGYVTVVDDDLADARHLSVILVDEANLHAHQEQLGELKANRPLAPLLLVTRSSPTRVEPLLQAGIVDDILRLPLCQAEIGCRLTVLVRLGQRSRTSILQLEELFKHASWGVAVIDTENLEIQAANQAFEDLHGLGREYLYQPFSSLASPLARSLQEEAFLELKRKGSHTFETEHPHAQGHILHLEVDATVVRDPLGIPLCIAAHVRDITQRKATEQELQTRNRELQETTHRAEQASRAKSDFLANISHEIRTPLHGVLATLSLLSRTDLSVEQVEYTRLLQGSSNSLLNLVNDILDFSTLQSGKFVLRTVPLRFQTLLNSLVDNYREQAAAKGLHLSLSTRGLPYQLLGDPVRLRQILRNLLSNALKFTESGAVELEATWNQEDNLLHCAVTDTGVGIAPAHQKKIFDVFNQEDNSNTRRFGGTGLGLTICQRLLRLMGGTLELHSAKGQGSRFSFNVPLPAVESEDGAPLDDARERSLKILVVEDEPINQRVMTLMLNELGHQVTLAGDGLEGVSKYEQEHFDLILMDLQMPRLGGLDAARLIREKERNGERQRTPIVAITARAQPGDPEKCLKAGIDDYYTKPIWLGRLRDVLKALVV